MDLVLKVSIGFFAFLFIVCAVIETIEKPKIMRNRFIAENAIMVLLLVLVFLVFINTESPQ